MQPADSEGIIPVAGLTTAAGEYALPLAFDATTIVADSVRFGESTSVCGTGRAARPPNGVVHIRDSLELDDESKDKDLDMVLSFRTSLTGIAPEDTEACMRWLYQDGGQLFSFFGCDVEHTIP